LFSKLPYDPLRDLAPITMTASNPMCLVTHPPVPAKSVKEFVALARARPGQLNVPVACQHHGAHRRRYRWRPHELVMWDNRCTMHRGTDCDDLRWVRDMRRVTVSDTVKSLRAGRGGARGVIT
jgi:hypothetical protein